jgi:hypothetical protein
MEKRSRTESQGTAQMAKDSSADCERATREAEESQENVVSWKTWQMSASRG